MNSNHDAAASRSRGFRLALITNLAGKGISTVTQFAVLPLAIQALGQQKFGVYAMLAALLNWMSIASVAITPGLTAQLVSANANSDRPAESRAFGSAFIFSSLLALLLYCAAQVAFHLVGIENMFGAANVGYSSELWNGLNVLSAFIVVNLVLSIAEAAQAGYQRQYVHNLFLGIGGLLTIIAIALVVRAKPTIANMIIAVYGGPLIARAISFAQLLWARPHLTGGMIRIDGSAMKTMLKMGSAFLLTSIGSFAYQSFSVYWVGRSAGALAATQMAIFTTILNVLGSILLMITQPLWPAIRDASVRGETVWITRAYLRLVKLLAIYTLLSAAVVLAVGDKIMQVWLKKMPSPGTSALALLGVYFLLLAWEQFNYSVLIGLGRFWFASISYFAGALVMLSSGAWLMTTFGIKGMLTAMCLGPLLTTAWLYPKKLHHLLAESGGRRFSIGPTEQ